MTKITALMLSAIVMFSSATYSASQSGLLDSKPAASQTAAEKYVGKTAEATEAAALYAVPVAGSKSDAKLNVKEKVVIDRQLTVGSTEWVTVRSNQRNVSGWVQMSALQLVPEEEVIPPNAPRGVVTTWELNIRTGPGVMNDRVGSYKMGERIAILEKKDGWGRTVKGWVYLGGYVYMEGAVGANPTVGTITANYLNVRVGPGTEYDACSSYAKNQEVLVLEQVSANGLVWGYTNRGWICMAYVQPYQFSDDTPFYCYGMVNSTVNIRAVSNDKNSHVGKLNPGTLVMIYEITPYKNTYYGRMDKGWINMDSVSIIKKFKHTQPTLPTQPPTEAPTEAPTEEPTAPTQSAPIAAPTEAPTPEPIAPPPTVAPDSES